MWESQFRPGDRVLVKHFFKKVEAVLIRKKEKPIGAWVCTKLIKGKWTQESVVNESFSKMEKY